MKIAVANTGVCQKSLTVEVAAEAVAAAREQAVRDLARAARVPGFRVGHAPRDLVIRHYGDQAREETIRRVIGEYLPQALAQSKLDLLGDPEVTAVSLNDGRPMAFTARCEIMPEIPLRPARGLKLTRPAVAVTDAQVESVLTALQERHATLEPVAGQAEKVKRVPPLDDAFAALVGVETLEALRARVREDLTRELTAQAQRAVEEQAIQRLLEQTTFEVPPSLVQSQGQRLLREAQWRLLTQGTAPGEVTQRTALLTDQAQQGALRQVKAFFLLRQLAKTHGLMATEAEIEARIAALAARSQRTPAAVRAELQRERLVSELAWDITRAKVLEWILAQAEITEKESSL
ncbi:MAG: trigger factor [Candidatus Omnitrophica bacterium]|nr:trigger factor [Candidatus Omnitrophota bacterium]